jgi:hypothetical protein
VDIILVVHSESPAKPPAGGNDDALGHDLLVDQRYVGDGLLRKVEYLRYDAATNTVTLVPTTPIKSSGTYTISRATPLATHLLLSAQGAPIQGNLSSDGPQVAAFAFTLRDRRTVTFTPASPERVSTSNG